jgi:hypothetical protein
MRSKAELRKAREEEKRAEEAEARRREIASERETRKAEAKKEAIRAEAKKEAIRAEAKKDAIRAEAKKSVIESLRKEIEDKVNKKGSDRFWIAVFLLTPLMSSLMYVEVYSGEDRFWSSVIGGFIVTFLVCLVCFFGVLLFVNVDEQITQKVREAALDRYGYYDIDVDDYDIDVDDYDIDVDDPAGANIQNLDIGSEIGLVFEGEEFHGVIIEFDDDEGLVVIETEDGEEITGYQDDMFIE